MSRISAFLVVMVLLVVSVGTPADASIPGLEFTDTGCEGHSDSVARLYAAGLGREPELAGFEFWMQEYTAGRRGLLSMSNFFVTADEFDLKYGSLSQLAFVNQMYRNVLGRDGDAGGLDYWDGRMNLGMTRGELLMNFAESPENITRSGTMQPRLGAYNQGLSGPWDCAVETDVQHPVLPAGNPGDVKNCGDFLTQSEAQHWFDTYYPAYGDVASLDQDGDGVPCETLP